MRAAAIAMLATGAAVMALLVPGISDAPAHANPSAGFDAGNIIDDALFYDGTAWNAAQIQSFLNQRVPRCTIGDPGRGAYTPWGNTTIAGACLNGSLWTTPARPANAYCSAMAGAVNESAASYIARVGAACGISPKVLLVMLEKEQSLVTDTWPTFRQYDFAMGYDCPDSGPNNSPNCSSGAGGFPAQMYRGAWQLKVYKAFPNSYNYKPFQWNRIKWAPDDVHRNPVDCGTSDVWIANWATAALYIYTPYRPNQAALNAGWGTGDACSSYGNRNFYNFYTSWFGSTRGVAVDAALADFYNQLGGAEGVYGLPLAAATVVGAGKMQEFAGGTLYWKPGAGNGGVTGAIRTLYNQNSGPVGAFGFPRGAEKSQSGGLRQEFEGATAYWSSRTGAVAVSGDIRSMYHAERGANSEMGFPKAMARSQSGGLRQEFEGATAYWSSRTGAVAVSGDIRSMYHAERGANSEMGFPKAMARSQSGGLRQEFEGATAYWSSRTGAVAVSGDIRSMYHAERGANSEMGFPKAMARSQSGGLRQEFEGATAYWSSRTGAVAVSGDIRSMYHAERGANSEMGFPKAMARSQSGGLRQEFEGATAYWSSRTGAVAVSGEIRALYHSLYGANGALGFPLGAAVEQNGTRTQRFEGGTIVWTAQRGAEVEGSAGRLSASEPLPNAEAPKTEGKPEPEAPEGTEEAPPAETDDTGSTGGEAPFSKEPPTAVAE